MGGETQKICNITDDITKIRYKIIYRKSANRYEIWTQFYDDYGKRRRNRITFPEALAVENDCAATIAYVNDCLVANHINIYVNTDNERRKTPQSKKVGLLDKDTIKQPCENLNYSDLDSLFSAWITEQENEPDIIWQYTRGSAVNITKRHFRRDGIINADVYGKEKRKILFISSEANDDSYSAKENDFPSTVEDYIKYHNTGYDDWKGKMRERLSEIYKVLSNTDRDSMSNSEAALHFAVMDINKRGGGANIGKDHHIEAYCKQYSSFIKNEIEIIAPDVIAFIGQNLFKMNLHCRYLGAINDGEKSYFIIHSKKVPILSLWQTSYFQGKCECAIGYEDNMTIGKQVTRAQQEMKKYQL